MSEKDYIRTAVANIRRAMALRLTEDDEVFEEDISEALEDIESALSSGELFVTSLYVPRDCVKSYEGASPQGLANAIIDDDPLWNRVDQHKIRVRYERPITDEEYAAFDVAFNEARKKRDNRELITNTTAKLAEVRKTYRLQRPFLNELGFKRFHDEIEGLRDLLATLGVPLEKTQDPEDP